jgi:diguanylate cyclase (GGDEF)-like protein
MRNNTLKHLGFTMTPLIENRQLMGIILIFQDITAQTEQLKELNYLATHDALTGINNKNYFLKEAQKEMDRSFRYHHAYSLLMLDIDDFKLINDQYGHLAGDAVIKTLSQIFKKVLVSSDIIGRYGGEEFIILLVEANQASALKKAEEIRHQIEQAITTYDELQLQVTVSIGVYSNLNENSKPQLETIIKCADEALYKAKNNGKNQVYINN